MSRTMPTECPHGAIADWCDFGDGPPEYCPHGCNGPAADCNGPAADCQPPPVARPAQAAAPVTARAEAE